MIYSPKFISLTEFLMNELKRLGQRRSPRSIYSGDCRGERGGHLALPTEQQLFLFTGGAIETEKWRQKRS